MFDLFFMGSPAFMGILTLLFFAVVVLSAKAFMKGKAEASVNLNSTELIKSVGLLSLIIGMLGFLIGMFSAMSAIETAGGIAPGVLAGGLKVALITPAYGLIIYGVSHLVSIFLRR